MTTSLDVGNRQCTHGLSKTIFDLLDRDRFWGNAYSKDVPVIVREYALREQRNFSYDMAIAICSASVTAANSVSGSGGGGSGSVGQVDFMGTRRWAMGMAALVNGVGIFPYQNFGWSESQISVFELATPVTYDGVARAWIKHSTQETDPVVGPLLNNEAYPQYSNKFSAVFGVSKLSTYYVFVGLANDTIVSVAAPFNIATTANAARFVGLGYDGSVSSNWLLYTGDGTNASAIDTGVAAAVTSHAGGKVYRITIDWTAVSSVTFTLESTTDNVNPEVWSTEFSISKSTNIPTDGKLGFQICHSITGVDVTYLWVSKFTLEQN